MKYIIKKILVIFLLYAGGIFAQIPQVPVPPRLVNDFAGLFTNEQIYELENKLVAFNDTTSNVICVVTVNDLGDYSAAEFAHEIGEQWGVRDKKYENGIVILIKPRNETSGEVYIAVGYDLEGAVPDAIAKRIVEYEMIPALKEGQYYEGVVNALAVLMPLISGEISTERYQDNPVWLLLLFFGFILIIVIIILLIFRNKWKNNNHNNDGQQHNNKDSFWKALWIAMLAANSQNSGRGFGGNSGWGGFGRGSGGGFGGFGGRGGFGGGGAGGRF